MNNVDGRTNEATHNTEELQLKNTDKTKQSRLTDKHEQPAILSNRCNKKHEHTNMNTDITMPKITHNLCQQDKAKYNTTCTNRDTTDKPQHNKYEQTNNIHTHTHTLYMNTERTDKGKWNHLQAIVVKTTTKNKTKTEKQTNQKQTYLKNKIPPPPNIHTKRNKQTTNKQNKQKEACLCLMKSGKRAGDWVKNQETKPWKNLEVMIRKYKVIITLMVQVNDSVLS